MPPDRASAPILSERIAVLESKLEAQEAVIKECHEEQQKISEAVAKSSGGLKVLMWIGGSGVAVISLLRVLTGHLPFAGGN